MSIAPHPAATASGTQPPRPRLQPRQPMSCSTTPSTVQTSPIALWRYGIISPLLHSCPQEPTSLLARLREAAAVVWTDPQGQRRLIPAETMRSWIYQYRKGGIGALADQPRTDKGTTEVGQNLLDGLASLRDKHPTLTTQRLLSLAHEQGSWNGVRPSRSAIYRAVAARGLQRRKTDNPSSQAAKAFAYSEFGQMWTADFLHGPKVRIGNKLQKLYLLAIIDDASRYIVHASFYITEGVQALIHALSIAIKRFGIPQRFYTDNGSAFRSLHLQMISARLGFVLPHTPAYTPQGRGKIERFFRTTRDQFLDGNEAPTRQAWNQKLVHWIDQYHHRRHEGIDATPLDKRLAMVNSTKPFLDLADPLGKAFLMEATRKVRRDGTINLDSKVWDIPDAMPGEVISILHAPWEPDTILVGPEHRIAKPIDRLAQANRFAHNPVRGNKEISP